MSWYTVTCSVITKGYVVGLAWQVGVDAKVILNYYCKLYIHIYCFDTVKDHSRIT